MKTISSGRTVTDLVQRGISLAALISSVMLATTAGAQTPDGRFQPWLGCWTSSNGGAFVNTQSDVPEPMVCVVPAQTGNGVTVLSIANNTVMRREQISGTGERASKTLEGCPGFETATWSTDHHRLLLKSEYMCGANTKVTGSSIMSISSDGEWIQVEGTTVGQNASTNVMRYHAAGRELVLTPGQEIRDSMTVTSRAVAGTFAVRSMRILVGEPVKPLAVLEVSKHVDAPVAEAWLNELGQGFALDGKTLVTLADGGMPSTMIDLMVALSYPSHFAVRRNAGDSTMRGNKAYGYGRGDYGRAYGYADRLGCSSYGYYDDPWIPSFGYGIYGGVPYGYSAGGCGYGRNFYLGEYYNGFRPVIIVPRGSGGDVSTRATGHAVKGGGYTRDSGPTQSNRTARPDGSSGSTTSQGSSTTKTSSGSGSSSSGSSSGGSTGRTAKARPPA